MYHSREGLGALALERGEVVRAVALFERALAIRGELDQRDRLPFALYNLCLATYRAGDRSRSVALSRELLAASSFLSPPCGARAPWRYCRSLPGRTRRS